MSARWIVLVVLAALVSVAAWAAFAEGVDQGFAGLGADAAGFDRPIPGTPLVFPRDLGPHPGFRTEWWYLTANLQDESGAAYGVQWTLFRQAGAPRDERQGWANQTVWMGHAAVTDAAEHLFAETFARGGVGQAGVTAEPFRAWIDDWVFEARPNATGADVEAAGALSRAKISASGPDFRYAFDLAADKPLVLHGDNGFSRKSDDGRASYYFSQPFFRIDGVLVLHGRKVQLSGLAWMDREWSSQQLAATQKGWDWFALHLSTGEKVMVDRLRDPTHGDFCAGTWIGADGARQTLDRNDIALQPLSEAHVAGRILPVRWRLQVKSRGIDVETAPVNAASWMATRFPYWEGPIAFHGSHEGKGYLEMTGY